jgi:glycosyltransferase involved in cell wall biosynthesis
MKTINNENNLTEIPLVSIIVITYNSSKYVLETLESAKAQTFKNIELIISDDCSTDNTVEICEEWIKENDARFVRAELIKAEKNKGIAPNCNQGLFKAKGVWIKFIAGDDILLRNCIAINLKIVGNSEHSFFFSQMKYTKERQELENLFESGFELMKNKEKQLKILLKGNCLPAPTAFIRRSALIELNGFDERFPMIEDYPCWINAAKNNFKIETIDLPTIIYRVNDDGVSQNSNNFNKKELYNGISFKQSWYNFIQKTIIIEQLKNLMLLRSLNNLIDLVQFKVAVNLFKNKNFFLSLLIFKLFSICKPSKYYNLFKKC